MDKTLIVFWSSTGNTEAMANGIAKGIEEAGGEVEVISVDTADAALIDGYTKIAFGCPSMGDEVLEEDEFEPFFESIEDSLSGKKVALFGSYDWGDGEWMRNWVERTEDKGAAVLDSEGFIQNLEPDEDECVEYGKKVALF